MGRQQKLRHRIGVVVAAAAVVMQLGRPSTDVIVYLSAGIRPSSGYRTRRLMVQVSPSLNAMRTCRSKSTTARRGALEKEMDGISGEFDVYNC